MSDRFAELHELLRLRRSGRAFAARPVPRAVLERLLEAARWAESCFNLQPWRFVVASEPASKARLGEALNRGNAWALTAPVLIAVASREDLDKLASDGRAYYLFDTGLAVQNLVIQAVSEGLMAHLMAGFDPAKAREALGIPETFTVITVIALGYPGDPASLSDPELRARETAPRTRKPLEEIAAFEGWDRRLEPGEG